MDKIFIEAQYKKTSEFNFIHTVVSKHCCDLSDE